MLNTYVFFQDQSLGSAVKFKTYVEVDRQMGRDCYDTDVKCDISIRGM